jgi:hypothetical protein
MASENPKPMLEITVHGEEEYLPLLLNVTSFLEDFTLLYEFARLGTDPKYPRHPASLQYSWDRNSRPLAYDDRLRVCRIEQGSPFLFTSLVVAVPAAVTAFWGIVQTIEKIRNWGMNRELLELQREKLRKELADAQKAHTYEGFRYELRSRDLDYFYDRTVDRLAMNPVRIREIQVSVISNP